MYEHKHLLPPALVVFDDKKYIVPGWTPVPMDTELSDIKHIKPVTQKSTNYTVIGSKGDKYNVTVNKTRITCDCPAGKFRGKCKHINEIKEKINEEKLG